MSLSFLKQARDLFFSSSRQNLLRGSESVKGEFEPRNEFADNAASEAQILEKAQILEDLAPGCDP